MKSNAALTEEYFAIADSLQGDIQGRRSAFAYMQNSTAIVHHKVVASSFIPRLFNDESWSTLKDIAETTHRILCKVISHYLKEPSYRSVFSYDKRLEELILLPRGYDDVLPFARIDVFLNEDDMSCKFCEFNGDGSAGMNENREITNSIATTETYRQFCQTHDIEPCELFESWVIKFIDIFTRSRHAVPNARFAICDYLECGVVDEFKVFSEYFKRHGYECVICDVRDLRFDGTVLRDKDNQPIHAIWRRCVTNDVLTYWDESQDLIEALRHGAVALIGSFAGHIVHDKQIFEALYHPKTKAILTDEENEFVENHVPRTAFLNDNDIELREVRNNKDGWIIKPTDNYGARDVYAGVSFMQSEWNELIDRFANEKTGFPFIAQSYITPFKTHTLAPDTAINDLDDSEIDTKGSWYNNLSGLYLYNGTFQGIFSRLGPLPTISKEHQGMTAATLHVRG